MTSQREEVERAAAPGGDSPLNASSTTGTGIGTSEDAEFRLEQCERGWIQDRARIRRLEEHLERSLAEIDQIERMLTTSKWESDHSLNSGEQQSKRNEVVRAHAIGPGSKKAYAGKLPYCNRNCKAPVASTSQRAHVANKKAAITCYECGGQGHFRNEGMNARS
nr:reverse transcriptase domain-containing protein [Tanacetum cinerariifolium]